MTYRTRILYFILLQLLISQLYAQDPVMSHFYANATQLNPSLAGIEGPAKIYIGYRNQWPNTGSSFVTYQASYDQYIDKIQGGIGLRMLNDRHGNGVFNAYNLDAMYAYQFYASRRLMISGGLQAGVGQRSFNSSSLEFGDTFNPVTGLYTTNSLDNVPGYRKFYPDFATGISAFYDNLYGGIAVHHLLNPVVTELNEAESVGISNGNRLTRRYTAHVGAIFSIIERRRGRELMKLSPNLVFIQQLNVQQINYGLDMIYRDFLLGLWTRHDIVFNYGNIIFNVGYSTNNIRFRYSYDVKISSPAIRLPNMGAHEISLLIIYENLNKRNKRRTIKCPKI
ncbi:PorP/SprF family type IX secretion system membrane protein [Bacteroidota bacterium]